jgi:antitoxin CcdA
MGSERFNLIGCPGCLAGCPAPQRSHADDAMHNKFYSRITVASNRGGEYPKSRPEALTEGLPMRKPAVAPKKTTSVSLAEPLLAQAKTLGINVSQAAEEGVAVAVARRRRELWLKENVAAIRSYNKFVEKHGMLLEKSRLF